MRRYTALIALALVASACGDAGSTVTTLRTLDSSSSETMPPAAAAPAPSDEFPDSDYPDVVVADLAGGEVNLRELALGDQPTLLWFWAPH